MNPILAATRAATTRARMRPSPSPSSKLNSTEKTSDHLTSRVRPPVIDALTGIRALAATWVVLQHFKGPIFDLLPGLRFAEPITDSGFLGVEVFFILSGFIISYNYAERLAVGAPGEYRKYIWARAARIWPVHIATLAVMGVLVIAALIAGVELTSEARNTPWNFFGNIFVLQAIPPFRGVNWPSWSVSCEVAAYIAFPVLARRSVNLSRGASLCWSAIILALGTSSIQIAGRSADFWWMSYPVMWLRIGFEFTIGVLLWSWWRHAPSRSVRGDLVACVALVGTLAICYWRSHAEPAVYLTLPLIAAFVVACASSSGAVSKALSSGSAQWAGRVSYSLYMTHFIVYLVAKKLVDWRRFAADPLWERIGVLAIWAALVLGTAAATFYLVEEPGRRLVRLWSQRTTRMP